MPFQQPPPAIIHTLADSDYLTRTVKAEAEGEPLEGQIAVAWVVVTRARLAMADPQRFGRYARGEADGLVSRVCLAPLQFSCWNCEPGERPAPMLAKAEYQSFRRARVAADSVLLGEAPNPMPGATHYHTIAAPKGAKTWPPKWAASLEHLGSIASHVFYRER